MKEWQDRIVNGPGWKWSEVHSGARIKDRAYGSLVNKHFVPIDQWGQEAQLIIYKSKKGNSEGLCLALKVNKRGIHKSYISHMEKEGPFFAISHFPEHNEGRARVSLTFTLSRSTGLGSSSTWSSVCLWISFHVSSPGPQWWKDGHPARGLHF